MPDATELSVRRMTPGVRRGYFGIGIAHPKAEVNFGTLLRSAEAFGASFAFVIGRRFRKQASDVWKSWRRMPVYEHLDIEALKAGLPYGCPLVGVELDSASIALPTFSHPERACYLLGAEDYGLTATQRAACHALVQIPGATACLNVATAGSIVLYDRFAKSKAVNAARVA